MVYGQIYKIVDIGQTKMYIGSTTEPLSKRMERHRSDYKQYLMNENIICQVFHYLMNLALTIVKFFGWKTTLVVVKKN